MRFPRLSGVLLAASLIAGAPAARALSPDEELPLPPGFLGPGDPGSIVPLPGRPPLLVRPGGRVDRPAVGRGMAETDPAPPPPKPPTRAEALDRLFGRLAAAADADEARGIVGAVEQLWMRSGSDTADLLMARAVEASGRERPDVAEALLDQVLSLEPGWAEAWNKRATLRYLAGDDVGSMEDISHVLALEPRHFGALSGMAAILLRHGEQKAALTAMRRVLALDPQDPEARKAVDTLTPEVEGHDL